jgi:hypothetical protein
MKVYILITMLLSSVFTQGAMKAPEVKEETIVEEIGGSIVTRTHVYTD